MSPILVRPVREQFEHDRVIRVLQARYKRKYEVAINPGAEQNASVTVGDLAMYPDLVLYSPERGRKLQATVEVETIESINTLEAMAEWGPLSRLRTPFFLYVPTAAIDTARRLCTEHSINPTEIWTYHAALDQVRFTMVHRSPDAPAAEPRAPRHAEARPSRGTDGRAGQAATPSRLTDTRAARSNHQAAEKAKTRVKAAKKTARKSLKEPAKKTAAKKAPRAAAGGRHRPSAAKAARKSVAKRSTAAKR